jgi:hypothetical protein
MPRVSRRLKRRRAGYTTAHLFQLLCGHDFFSDAFSRDLDAMREAWPLLRDGVFQLLAKRRAAGQSVRLRPWAWWQFEAPGQAGDGETELAALARLGLLTADERKQYFGVCPAVPL